MSGHGPFDSETGRAEAAKWLARRDRGLTPVEQDEYLQWLRERPDHAKDMAEQEATLGRLMGLVDWRPGFSSDPDPDLFAPARPAWRSWLPLAAAAAAVAAAGVFLWPHRPRAEPAAAPSHLVMIEPTILADGSRIEVRDGSAVDTRRYSPTQRQLELVGGEAAFTVMKDSSHPFVVDAAGVAVRAVGTVFDVQLNTASVAVLVSEGKVRVDHGDGPAIYVAAGERAVIPLAGLRAGATLARLDTSELNDDLAWRSPRFQFYETPLADAIGEFNRRNRVQIRLGDSRLAARRIGGTFRADNVGGFVRMLQSTMGLRAAPDGAGGFVLARSR